VAPIHPNSIHWIIRLGGNAGVLTKPATQAKNQFPGFKMHFSKLIKCHMILLVFYRKIQEFRNK